jgi:hypothetical protein
MSRSKKFGKTDAQIMRERLLNLIEYLNNFKGRPRNIKELAEGMDMIWPTSSFVATRDLKRLAKSDKCPNGVPVPQYHKVKSLAKSILERCEIKGRVDACYRDIARMFYKRDKTLGREMHQADILKTMMTQGYGFPTTLRALQLLIKRKLLSKRVAGKLHYYGLTKLGMDRSSNIFMRNENV